ncbi:fimbrial protein [Shewanella fidelis]|uniref:fimbrial protein n=1 Tax=Shewanella fidelis TaxID=173509 RepID=UPI0012EB6A6B|nr:hypothetical protein [Shewanella fidelis]
MTTFKAHALPKALGHHRCGVTGSGGDFDLHAVIQNSNIDPTTPMGSVLTTIEMEGGAWNFRCTVSGSPNDILFLGPHAEGGWSTAPSPNNDNTVCRIPGIQGIGIRFYRKDGQAKKCYTTIFEPNNIIRIQWWDGNETASYSPLAELVRIGDIAGGAQTLPNMPITSMITNKSLRHDLFRLVFTNPTLDAPSCTMAQFNQTIDFGSGIARGDEVISKPFDVWLTDCSGDTLTEFKNSAELSFTSSLGRISLNGTRLYNCDDDDCANGAYITFTDIEGDDVNLKDGYRLNAQTTDDDYKLSFSSNLHTENTTGGKIDTSLTLVISYL